jgi:hypothetical protein
MPPKTPPPTTPRSTHPGVTPRVVSNIQLGVITSGRIDALKAQLKNQELLRAALHGAISWVTNQNLLGNYVSQLDGPPFADPTSPTGYSVMFRYTGLKVPYSTDYMIQNKYLAIALEATAAAITNTTKSLAFQVDIYNGLGVGTKKPGGTKPPKTTGGGGGSQGNLTITPDNSPPKYNVPSIRSAYFGVGNKSLYTEGGSPATASAITNAQDLWAGSHTGGHKGMLQTYTYWNMLQNAATTNKKADPNIPGWYKNAYQKEKFAFQFLYNPGEVNMTWGGSPTVDPGLMASGKDVTPYIVPSMSSSTISFSLMVNRMPDFGLLETLGVGAVQSRSNDFYGQSIPLEDLSAIQQLGTMYDVEYLLSTLVGFRMWSDLRKRYTADMGFLMGLPVELHLGKDLRYLGTIQGFSIHHTIFGRNMVPLFTNISIDFARRIEPVNSDNHAVNGSILPQYSATNTTATTIGGGGNGYRVIV